MAGKKRKSAAASSMRSGKGSGNAPVRSSASALRGVLSQGPAKSLPKGPPAPRLSHHKGRAAWFRARVSWPLRDASATHLEVERGRARAMLPPFAVAADWQPVGPTNIGGRCTALLCHPEREGVLWVGAAGGGVWMSLDGGATWQPSWPADAPLRIGSLALDPADPSVLYCGTGEANLSADSYPGDGVYRSIDGGISWHQLASSQQQRVPTRIGCIRVDPFDARHLLLGGIGFGRLAAEPEAGGLYQSRDGGQSWQRLDVAATRTQWCHSIAFHPARAGRIWASLTTQGGSSGLYRSEDGGLSWQHLSSGLPPAARMGRTTIALAPSNPEVLYAFAADEQSRRADRLLGVFRSDDGGDHWRDVTSGHFSRERQISYGNTIVVHPQDEDHVLCGGVDLHLSRDGGASWQRVTRWDRPRGEPDYAHADHHALVMDPARPGRVYSANDGGVDVSDDGGAVWRNLSKGLAVTMFYDVDVGQNDARVLGGGAQDNGTVATDNADPGGYVEILGGDGGWIVIDPRDAGHLYASFQFGGMFRWRDGNWRDVSPPFSADEKARIWMVYITMDPNDGDCVYTGALRLYRTRDDGRNWRPVSPVFDGSAISAIEVAAADSNRLYVGTENGGVFRSDDFGRTWSADLRDGMLPGTEITRIATHPGNRDDVWVTAANSGNSHVFRSRDGGATWHDLDRGRLPDVPHHAVLVRPDRPEQVFVCNDVGVHVSEDGGDNWFDATGSLPPAMAVDLCYHRASRTLVAATYGRSIWSLALA